MELEEIKGLSLTQPWATLVANGSKRIETRSWYTSYRGLVAIQAALKYPGDCKDLRNASVFGGALRDDPEPLPRGVILAVARVEACIPTERLVSERTIPVDDYRVYPDSPEFHFGNFDAGRFGWVLRDVVKIEVPLACKGALGLFLLPVGIQETLHDFVDRFAKTSRF